MLKYTFYVHTISLKNTEGFDLNLFPHKIPPKIHILKSLCTKWWCWMVGSLGGDEVMRIEPSWVGLAFIKEDLERSLASHPSCEETRNLPPWRGISPEHVGTLIPDF